MSGQRITNSAMQSDNSQLPIINSNFVLVVAGEDSGDIIGEQVVKTVVECGFEALGTGGARMQSAGLKPLANFEDLAVSGFWDVLKKMRKLLAIKKTLTKKLLNKNCQALICIDYPGMNLPLLKIAKRAKKPIFYIAPPQIWAWKKNRGKHFKDVNVGAFFPFEEEIYKDFGANVVRIKHPLFENDKVCKEFKDCDLFLPGSRIGQLKRNLPIYVKLARKSRKKGGNPLFVASRNALAKFLTDKLNGEFPVLLKPRKCSFKGASSLTATPGTAILEAFIAGVPTEAVAIIDPLTYILGKIFLKTKYLTLPNILMKKEVVKERVFISAFICL